MDFLNRHDYVVIMKADPNDESRPPDDNRERLKKELEELQRRLNRQARYAACVSVTLGMVAMLWAYFSGQMAVRILCTAALCMSLISYRLSGPPSKWIRTLARPRTLELLSYILLPKARKEVFEPRYNEILEDYVCAKKKFDSKWEIRWLTFWFCVHTVLLIFGSINARFWDKLISTVSKLLRLR